MQIKRIIRHLLCPPGRVRRAFSDAGLKAIESAIQAAEAAHGGEIHVALEGALHGGALLNGLSAQARALDLFASLHVWDTDANNGVLIYVLLADRAVEIVADRHIHSQVGDAIWAEIVTRMQQALSRSAYQEGVLVGVQGVSEVLARHYPVAKPGGNRVPDRPTIL